MRRLHRAPRRAARATLCGDHEHEPTPFRRVACIVLFSLAAATTRAAPGRRRRVAAAVQRQGPDGWTPKITGYPLGENFANTFRVEDGVLKVAYDQYDEFDGKFGHLFYKTPFSHYRLRVEYRFVGEQCPAGPGWAFRNSGVMIHGQSPETMGRTRTSPCRSRCSSSAAAAPASAPRPTSARRAPTSSWTASSITAALHQLHVQDLPRRPVGDRRDRGPRQQGHPAHRQRRGRSSSTTSRNSTTRTPTPRCCWRRRREAARRRLHLAPVREPPGRVPQGGVEAARRPCPFREFHPPQVLRRRVSARPSGTVVRSSRRS